jgi:hypothetical protein
LALRHYHRLHLTKRPQRFQGVINLIEPITIRKHVLEAKAVAVVLQKLQGFVVVLGVARHDAQDRELFFRSVWCSHAILLRMTSTRGTRCATLFPLRPTEEHHLCRRGQLLPAQHEGALGDVADWVTPAGVLREDDSLLRQVDVHGNDQERP